MAQINAKLSKLQVLAKENRELKASIAKLMSSSRINKNMGADEFDWCCSQLALVKIKYEQVEKIPTLDEKV